MGDCNGEITFVTSAAENYPVVDRSAFAAENSDVDETHGTVYSPTAGNSDCLRIMKSIALYVSFLGLGLCSSVVGPTLVSMEYLLDTNTSSLSWAFIIGGLGYFGGAIICGLVFDRMNQEVQFAIAAMLSGLACSCSPFTGNIYGFVVLCGIQALGMGFIDSAGNSYAFLLWGRHRIEAPFLQGIHTIWSLGSTIGPFIVRPFLTDLKPVELENETDLTNTTLPPHTSQDEDDIEYVRYAFVTIGAIVMTTGFIFLGLYLSVCFNTEKKTYSVEMKEKQKKEKSDKKAEFPEMNKVYTAIFLVLVFVFFGVYSIIEGCTTSYLATFVVKGLGWDNRSGPLIVAVFQGALGLGRLVNTGISALLRPRTMLLLNMTFTMLSFVMMIFVQYHDVIMWISASLAGFCMASTFPTTVLWVSNYMQVTGFVSGVMVGGSAFMAVIYPLFVGHLFDSNNSMVMIYFILGTCIFDIFLFALMQAVVVIGQRAAKYSLTECEELNTVKNGEGNS